MKKIGIITFHRSHNCGSIMESFAMQTIVKDLGYENELINFSSEGQRDTYRVFSKKRKIKKYIKNILLSPYYSMLKRHFNDYESFIKKHLLVSKGDYSECEELEKIDENYDAYIAGSDQIWNITIADYNDAYFLPFTNKKKIAYAPSFGSKDILKYSDNPEHFKTMMNKFEKLSVREKNGQKWIKDLTGREAKLVLDPTLLIDKEKYFVLEEKSGVKGDYIFYYSPQYKKDIDKFVKKLSKKYNLPVIVWNSREIALKGLFFKGFKTTIHQNPGIYLDLIKNAKYIITTSFHGAIFSTIYNKKFWVMKNGDMYGEDDRVITLLRLLDLEDRLIEPLFKENFSYDKEVNYENYNKSLKKYRQDSIDYLKEALKDER